jgi:hypothetical protein
MLCGNTKGSSVTEYFVLTDPIAHQHMKLHYARLSFLESYDSKYTVQTNILISGDKFVQKSTKGSAKNTTVFS